MSNEDALDDDAFNADDYNDEFFYPDGELRTEESMMRDAADVSAITSMHLDGPKHGTPEWECLYKERSNFYLARMIEERDGVPAVHGQPTCHARDIEL